MSAISASAPDRPHAMSRSILAAPALVFVAVFTVGPLLFMLAFSGLKAAAFGGVEWELSGEAYRALLFRRDIFGEGLVFSPDHLVIFGRSLAYATLTTALCLIVGFPTAWFMATRKPAHRKWWILAITVPFWTSLLVRTLALMLILGDQGVVNGALIVTGFTHTPLKLLYTDFAVMIGLVYSALPFMVLPIYSSLERLDPGLVEAGADLYAGRWQILAHILVPAASSGILAGILLVFIPALGSYVVPLILGGGGSMLIGDLIALQFGSSRNWPLGAAESVVLMLGVLVAMLIHRSFARRPA